MTTATAVALLCLAPALSGLAVVLQARSARADGALEALHVGFVTRLLRDRTYLLSLLATAGGFATALLALRVLPVFVVQAVRASSLVVAALLAVRMLGAHIDRVAWGAVAAVVVGLAALASATDASTVVARPHATAVLVVAAAGVAVAIGVTSVLPASRTAGVALSLLSGVGFALVAAGTHLLPSLSPAALLGSPVAWSAAAGGLLGLLGMALGFQRAHPVTVTGVVTATETIVGALLGVLLAGDRSAPGRSGAALVGVALVLAGSVALARVAEQPPAA